MASNVNIMLSGWRATGSNVSTPQYEQTVQVQWTDDAGVKHTQSQLVRFPNVLAQVPAAWAIEEINDLIVRAARKVIGVD